MTSLKRGLAWLEQADQQVGRFKNLLWLAYAFLLPTACKLLSLI